MTEPRPSDGTSSPRSLGIFAAGGAVGGLAGAGAAVIVTLLIKETLGALATQDTWVLIVMPLVGLALSVAICRATMAARRCRPSRRRPSSRSHEDGGACCAGGPHRATAEERFPWHLAPPRIAAIVATVGLGGPESATLTCLATVLVATVAGVGAGLALDQLEVLWGAVTGRARPRP